jgi:hypothetical protein
MAATIRPTRQGWNLVAAAAALLGPACVDSGSALTILQNQTPLISSDNASCSIPGMQTETRGVQGTYDVALDQDYPYYLYPLLQNQLPALNASSVPPNRVNITSWEVKIEPPPGISVPWTDACPAEFDYPGPVLIDPGQQAASIIEVMRPCHNNLIRKLMESSKLPSTLSERVLFQVVVRAKGRHGGTEIKSDPFTYPIRVCYGCLQTGIELPAYAAFNFPKVPPCKNLKANPYKGNPCNVAQDFGPVLCCAQDVQTLQLQCPAVGTGD